jgi:hypothetical protein
VVIVVAINSLPNAGRGIRGPEVGKTLPDFAAPEAASDADADANVRPATGGSAAAGPEPACAVDGQDVVNICRLRERAVVLTFATKGCEEQLDRIEAIRGTFPGVAFAAVLFGMESPEAAAVARAHAWGFPVAADRDAAVFNLYRVADCPSTVFAYPGGEVRETRLGELSDAELTAEVRALVEKGGNG